jgi:hypothetical protein
VEQFHLGIQGTGSHPAIQGDSEAGGVSGGSVLAVVLAWGGTGRAAASIIVVCLTLGNVIYDLGRFLSPYRPLHELVVPKMASTAFLLIPGIAVTPHKFLKATAVARRFQLLAAWHTAPRFRPISNHAFPKGYSRPKCQLSI